MDIIRTLGVFLVYKKKGLIKMEMNELQTLRHSASHILAQAVKRLYPDITPDNAPYSLQRFQNRLQRITGPNAAPKPAHA